ncbi:MAG: hypothetical protein M1812_003880 [Candelaria pacifica]|nr:MAG: hypothetical protein M1812_003880 [Candelaria pacifica]
MRHAPNYTYSLQVILFLKATGNGATPQGLTPAGPRLNIYQPRKPSPNHNAIIYLPRGSIGAEAEDPSTHALSSDQAIEILSTTTGATIIRVAYRFSRHHRYPFPLHDVLAAYDWVLKHLAHDRYDEQSTTDGTASSRMQYTPDPTGFPRIGVYGELIGGTLATTLGLTECHTNKSAIGAIAVSNPILDWTFPSSNAQAAKTESLSEKIVDPLVPKYLSAARAQLFSGPEAHHDPFASPLLFFRTSSNPLPEYTDPALIPNASSPSGTNESDEESGEVRQRKYHLRYPPSASKLKLPATLISVNKDSNSLIYQQGAELATLMRRSISIHELGRKGTNAKIETNLDESQEKLFDIFRQLRLGNKEAQNGSNGDKPNIESTEKETEARIQLIERDCSANASHKQDGNVAGPRNQQLRAEMTEVGNWFRRVLK